ncbi:MAG: nitrous oxide reductase accessory protein NosL, partial [Rubricoccaceae bacterium]|nr:nitrous oxide reductase accessory protein NosL [Rubricoccaceae bacterium]
MTSRSRLFIGLATLLLGTVYLLPLWRVSLEAPQYPGGIGMQIRVNTITGLNPHDLQNINGLNHYIGMQEIVPDSIPELTIMPWLFGIMILFGLLVVATKKRALLYTWVGSLVGLLIVGFVDYYKWGYDYGHNLSPDAAIKIPGMAYQPPLIGSKQMLNFTAHSWPDTGGIAVFIALALGIAAVVHELRRRRVKEVEVVPGGKTSVALASLFSVFLLVGCEPSPEPLRVGEMDCSHCRMTVSDARFGAEVVSSTGKVYPFDAVECMLAYLDDNPELVESVHSYWVVAFDEPGTLIPADEAFFLRSSVIQSPMGAGIAAFASEDQRDAQYNQLGGIEMGWTRLLNEAESLDRVAP